MKLYTRGLRGIPKGLGAKSSVLLLLLLLLPVGMAMAMAMSMGRRALRQVIYVFP